LKKLSNKLVLVLCMSLVLCFMYVFSSIAQAVTLRISVPEHWQIIEPLKSGERDKVVPRRLWFYEIIQKFKEENANIQLEFESVPWDNLQTSYINKARAGDPPDIQMIPNGMQYLLARAGFLYPLDKFDLPWEDFSNKLFENNMKVDGKIYLMPCYTMPHVLYYNQALFNEAGISGPPETLEELVAFAKKLTIDRDGDGKPEVWGFGLPASMIHPAFVYQNIQTLVWLYGGNVAKDGKAILDTEEMGKALQFYHDNVYKHKITPKGSAAWDKEYMSLFREGLLAMTIRGAEEYKPAVAVLGDNTKMAPIPVLKKGDPYVCWAETFGWVLSAKTAENPEKLQAAWKVLESLVSEFAFVQMAKYQNGLPVRESVLGNPIFENNPIIKFLSDYAVEAGRYDPEIAEWNFWGDTIARMVEATVLDLKPIDELMKEAQDEYNARVE